jgi:hypothetical protein
VGDENPCLGTFDRSLPILCPAAASPEPSEGALDDSSTGENLKPLGGVGAFHDLNDPTAYADQSITQFRSGIAPVRKYILGVDSGRGQDDTLRTRLIVLATRTRL